MTATKKVNKTFLKWAGNKQKIVHRIKNQLYNHPSKRLIEPFAGSGAVFLNTEYESYILADTNKDLINLFNTLKNDGNTFIRDCSRHFTPETNTEQQYYAKRKEFNSLKLNKKSARRKKAALFLYLNRHCYNGLCRYNLKGEFNVPFGRYKKPYFPEDELNFFYKKSHRDQPIFKTSNFESTMSEANEGDVIYCDPPYIPLSTTANFTSYTKLPFGYDEQKQLTIMAESKAKEGVTVLISNHDTLLTRKLYCKAKIVSFEVRRFISCDGANRSKAPELLALFKPT
jgi:DNA adenine methylase